MTLTTISNPRSSGWQWDRSSCGLVRGLVVIYSNTAIRTIWTQYSSTTMMRE